MKGIGLLIGVGSVGKKHAKTMSEIFDILYVVDIDNNALDWCKDNLKCSLKLFNNLEQAIYENNELQNTVCLIANWGPDHFDVLIKLIQNGAKSFYVEKPFVNSIEKIEEVKQLALSKDLNIVSGFFLRHSGLYEKVKEVSENFLGGRPSSIVLEGGACCIVTNGIHFLDFAIQMFNSEPISTLALMNDDKINPRSPHLGFWDGFASWKFSEDRNFSISFSNKSSAGHVCNIYCPKGVVNIRQGRVKVFKRNEEEVKADPRMTRTGEVFYEDLLENWEQKDFFTCSKDLILELKSDRVKFDLNSETIATESMIAALISSEKKSYQTLPIDSKDNFYKFDWPIS